MGLIDKVILLCFVVEGWVTYRSSFVESEERADELMEYFDKIPKSTNSILIFP